MRPLRIATRRSPLALWQAKHIAERLAGLGVEVGPLVDLSTEGDRFLSAPLSGVGGKGLFVKEIEQALLENRADLAVHSLKDMTNQMPERLVLACVPAREDPRDALVGPRASALEQLPPGASVGTSSLRRSCQLLERRPDLRVVALRGNVQTRLNKVAELGLAGAVLALAGLKRLGLAGEVAQVLEPEVLLPAAGQGVLAVQCREDDAFVRERLLALEDPPTRVAITAERSVLAELEGGCTVPMAAYARTAEGSLWLRALVGSPDGARVIRGQRRGPADEAARMGRDLALELLARGARELLGGAG